MPSGVLGRLPPLWVGVKLWYPRGVFRCTVRTFAPPPPGEPKVQIKTRGWIAQDFCPTPASVHTSFRPIPPRTCATAPVSWGLGKLPFVGLASRAMPLRSWSCAPAAVLPVPFAFGLWDGHHCPHSKCGGTLRPLISKQCSISACWGGERAEFFFAKLPKIAKLPNCQRMIRCIFCGWFWLLSWLAAFPGCFPHRNHIRFERREKFQPCIPPQDWPRPQCSVSRGRESWNLLIFSIVGQFVTGSAVHRT